MLVMLLSFIVLLCITYYIQRESDILELLNWKKISKHPLSENPGYATVATYVFCSCLLNSAFSKIFHIFNLEAFCFSVGVFKKTNF